MDPLGLAGRGRVRRDEEQDYQLGTGAIYNNYEDVEEDYDYSDLVASILTTEEEEEKTSKVSQHLKSKIIDGCIAYK